MALGDWAEECWWAVLATTDGAGPHAIPVAVCPDGAGVVVALAPGRKTAALDVDGRCALAFSRGRAYGAAVTATARPVIEPAERSAALASLRNHLRRFRPDSSRDEARYARARVYRLRLHYDALATAPAALERRPQPYPHPKP